MLTGACEGGDEPQAAPPPPGEACLANAEPAQPAVETLRVGVGSGDAFRELVDGETLVLEHGAQGGQHVMIALRLFTPEAGSWRLEARLVDASGQERGSRHYSAETCAMSWFELYSFAAFLEDDDPFSGILTVTAQTGAAPALSRSVAVEVVDGPRATRGRCRTSDRPGSAASAASTPRASSSRV